MFPVVTTNGATFINDNRFLFAGGFFISLIKNLKILFLGLWTHSYTSVSDSLFGNIGL